MIGGPNKKIGFLGAGNMAEAIISGIIKGGVSPKNIFISDVSVKRLNYIFRKYKVNKCTGNSEAVKFSDAVFLAVKPHQAADVLAESGGSLSGAKLLISVAAGVKTSKIEKYAEGAAVVRVMPNTPALIGGGAIAVTPGRYAKKADVLFAKKLLSFCGIVVDVSEKDMDAVTAVSGSGPAYVFYVAEIMIRTAVKLGLSRETAGKLVRQTLLGASGMLVSSIDEPEILRQKVTSKGGTTAAAFKILSAKKFGNIFEEAIVKAAKRSKEMSNG